MEPSVLFLKPPGHDSPDASCRWIWLSVVRAPIAPQHTRSPKYCGEIGSRYSVPVATPRSISDRNRLRAVRRPRVMSYELLRCGSLIRPFQPTVVRGFSK